MQKVNHAIVLNVCNLIGVVIKGVVHIMNYLVVPVCIGNDIVLLNIGNDNVVDIHHADVVVSHCVLYSNTIECFNFLSGNCIDSSFFHIIDLQLDCLLIFYCTLNYEVDIYH